MYEYLRGTYAASAAISVRRHTRQDNHARDASLIGLLLSVRRTPEILTRDRHIAFYEQVGMPARLAERGFDRLAAPGARYLEPRHVQGDIDALHTAADDLEQYATQRIAHLDKRGPTVIPTFDDLDGALDVFERLVKRYRLLLRGDGGEVVPVLAEPWEAVLEVPWIPPRK